MSNSSTFLLSFQRFIKQYLSLGSLLLLMVVIALIWANSPWHHSYHALWETEIAIVIGDFEINEDLHHWINDFLMAYFFFMVGLEIKREVIDGQLSTVKQAVLPVAAAIGGMLLPALLYLAVNYNTPGSSGWGIPMATDIAFAIGLLAFVGKAVSSSAKTFLTALATADDLGAILIIAFFLTTNVDTGNLLAAAVYFAIMLVSNIIGIRNTWFYFVVGVFGLWVALLLSGVHATLAGVLVAFCIPGRSKIPEQVYINRIRKRITNFEESHFREGPLVNKRQLSIAQNVIKDSKASVTPLQRLEENVKPFVYFFVLPLFALCNAGLTIGENFFDLLLHPISLGVILGLVVGKLLGIGVISRLLVRLGAGQLPPNTTWSDIGGLGLMAGIGFTMSIFIAELALEDQQQLQIAKIGILVGSCISGFLGILWLKLKKST
ncbi:MAG: Na+/H+ antiporter NhaA [Cytophagaceae bacterium]|nr:Na+/H+ antiporter NhaA [Cytophagaceae bacterium]